jgi:hypothetical protein
MVLQQIPKEHNFDFYYRMGRIWGGDARQVTLMS